MKRYLFSILNIALLCAAPQWAGAQTRVMSDCFSALQVKIPFETKALQQMEKAADEMPVVSYLFEDQFSFWYRIEVAETDSLKYTVWPSEVHDQFQTVFYQSDDSTLCRQLVDGDVQPEQIIRSEILVSGPVDTTAVYHYQVAVEEGHQYYLSILSLHEDFCGHRLELEFNGERLHFHAMNKPCYDFAAIDNHSLSPVKTEEEENPVLELISLSADTQLLPPEGEVAEPPVEQEKRAVEDYTRTESNRTIRGENPEPKLGEMNLEIGSKLNLKKVFFHNNTYAFRGDSESQLNELLQLMIDNPSLEIEIGGHSSGNTKNIRPDPFYRERGKEWNFKGSAKKLSKMRAEAVKNFLMEKGISEKRLSTVGYGDSEKVVENARTPDEHRRNMRVEIAIISAD